MGVTIVTRKLADGQIAFSLDVSKTKYKRFRQNTGIKAPFPKTCKAYKVALRKVEDQKRQVEKDLERDPGGVFSRKARSTENFIEFFRLSIAGKKFPAYLGALKYLHDFSGGSIPFESLNAALLERFKDYLLSCDEIIDNTASSYLVITKSIIRQAWRQGFIPEDFCGKVRGIKVLAPFRHFLTLEQVEALSRSKCDNEMVKQAFLFACFSGPRLSDIIKLQWSEISLINGSPFIQFQQKKTGQHETCPIPEQAVKILADVKKLHPYFAPEGNDRVFILPAYSEIMKVLKTWGGRSGLSWNLHFHVSRHTAATLMLTSGADLYTVSKQLGHKNIRETQKYARVIDLKRVSEVQMMPTLSPLIEPLQAALLPASTALTPEHILQPRPAMTVPPGSIAEALHAKGEKIAGALSLRHNGKGKYIFNDREFTAIELAMEV